jgi:hypothetical protein
MELPMPRLQIAPDGNVDDDSQPVMVPRNQKPIVTTSPERAARLRTHLATVLSTSGLMTNLAPASAPEPESFASRVARTACSLCKGWCCRNGEDDAFLDERTLARVRQAQPEMNAEAILQLYGERVPAAGYSGSCIFHGKAGCTLDRTLRSDVCNSYFCGGLFSYLKSNDAQSSVVVIAGEGNEMRTSPVLLP